jgi:hypothetical protein
VCRYVFCLPDPERGQRIRRVPAVVGPRGRVTVAEE